MLFLESFLLKPLLPIRTLHPVTRSVHGLCDPFGTWFVLPTRNLADVILRHPIAKERLILPDHMLTARDFAQYICRETDPDLYILSSGEQDLLIRRILTSPDLRKSTASLFGEVTHTTCSGHSSPVLSKI